MHGIGAQTITFRRLAGVSQITVGGDGKCRLFRALPEQCQRGLFQTSRDERLPSTAAQNS